MLPQIRGDSSKHLDGLAWSGDAPIRAEDELVRTAVYLAEAVQQRVRVVQIREVHHGHMPVDDGAFQTGHARTEQSHQRRDTRLAAYRAAQSGRAAPTTSTMGSTNSSLTTVLSHSRSAMYAATGGLAA